MEATYSAEDNKLRLYASGRLDEETYQRIRALGFRWAPKQELFVAPKWTPAREDILIELAGEIEPEGTTIAERAEAKAERLDALSEKRAREASAFSDAAHRISERFAGGQPILVGHHSERKARKDQERMHRAMDRAVQASRAVGYWAYRAEGVERHANRKSNPAVRARRIKKLLAELRGFQREINHAYKCLRLWEKIQAEPDAETREKAARHFSGCTLDGHSAAPWELWGRLNDGKATTEQAIAECVEWAEQRVNSEHTARWISHTLNRLAFERSELGPVERFTGELTATILQSFAREQGADKPKAAKDGERWQVVCRVPLPVHLADGKELALSADEWRDLMQAVGYEVPEKQARPDLNKLPPILNFRAPVIVGQHWGKDRPFPQVEMTREEYKRGGKDSRCTRTSACGSFRFRAKWQGTIHGGGFVSVFIMDSKEHPAPDSPAIRSEPGPEVQSA